MEKEKEEIAKIRVEASRRRPAIGGGENVSNGSPRNCKRTIQSDIVHEALCSGIARRFADRRTLQTRGVRSRIPVVHTHVCAYTPFKKRERKTERRREGADSAHDTHVYTRKANSNDGHVYSMRTVHFVHVHTLYTLARFHVPHIDSVAARTLLHARARMEYERERERGV